MSRFSERMGIKSVRSVMQVDSMDDDLRNGLWNALDTHIWSDVYGHLLSQSPRMETFCRRLWRHHFRRPMDEIPPSWHRTYSVMREYFFSCDWNEVYDFVEFAVGNYPDDFGHASELLESCKGVLKRELSAYRFAGGEIRPLTSEQEIAEIEKALAAPDSLSPVTRHIEAALDFFGDRRSPDYRNSIKESISAVEALCQLITGDSSAHLGRCLKHLDDRVPLHGALQSAFRKLYAYSSEAEGIRHALSGEPTLGLEDARFWLVSCSAFINYLVEKASKAGIEL